MARLFVAVWPPPEVVAELAALDRPPVVGLRWTVEPQWHVTLRFLGRVEHVREVRAAMEGVRTPVGEAVLGPATGRFGHRILHAPVAGLEALAADVVAATAHLGQPPEPRPFSGHITLARVSRTARVDLRPLAGVPVAGRWPVREVTLVESRLWRDGARYEVVGRWELP